MTPFQRTLAVFAAVAIIGLAGSGLWQAARSDPATAEDQVESIAQGLRCPTCQGLSVADSAAPIATSMRDIIDEQLAAGRTPEEIRAYFVQRYGDWILLSPRASGLGWLVWTLPVIALLGGGAVAYARTRQPADRVGAPDLDHAANLIALHDAGRIALPQSPAGDRLEAALDAAVAADEDSLTEPDRAVLRVAGALAAQRREAQAPTVTTRPTPRLSVTRRSVAWTGGAAAFAVLLVGLLVIGTGPRGAGELLTGSLPVAGSTPAPEGDIEDLRAAVAQDPQDIAARLALASGLLQAGDVAGARTEARTVLDQRPDQPDGLLMLGLAMAAQDDPTAPQTLQRYLNAAPPEHPGIPLARSLVDSSS